MNIRKINQWNSCAIVALVLLLGSCTKEPIETNGDPTPDSEGVAVSLTLLPKAMQSPASGTSSMASPSVKSAASDTGMDVQLIDEPATRAVDDGAVVNNVWIIQFNGSGDNALLTSKQYMPSYSILENIKLKPGADQRIVVLANSDDAKLADALTTTTTWANVKWLSRPIANAMNGAVPMSGNIVTNIVKDGVYHITLTRTFAKVTLRIKLGKGMATTGWQIQPFNFPNGYWFPGTSGVFPLAGEVKAEYMVADANITLSTTEYKEFSYYLPVNLRGTVSGTTAQERRTKAPEKSTYIKVFRSAPEGNTLVRTNYYFHMGSNLTDDYNLHGNTQYTYQAVLYADAGSDSRVENANMDITGMQRVGRFAGKLEGRNGVWQFTKELWVSKANDGKAIWGDDMVTNVKDKIDGKENTATLVALGGHAAANLCYNKAPATEWYLPAHNQLQAVWVMRNMIGGLADRTWTSFESSMTSCWYVNMSSGDTGRSSNYNKLGNNNVRCVREL